ncbi:MAG: alpha/beta fold hydrolase [Planctomycetia bacterium]|nr:alpha/beta fold hydrolase [Planctomycetia bacterium]
MSTLLLDQTGQLAADSGTRNATTVRTAFYLTSRNEPLCAWLHTARDRAHVDHGVVICAPLGFEQLHANRSLRHLADAIAGQGIPTLRFDWHGTGDSAGSDADASRRPTWHANVRDAVAWMRTTLGCRRVSIVGLRMGAMLAVEALGHDECDNLVLWAPATCGKSYMRQMQTIEQLAESRPRPDDAPAGDVEAAGFLISEETAGQFVKCNLLQKELSCLHALLVGPFDKRLVERFAQFEIPVEQISLPGFAEMMAEPHYSQVPQQTVAEIARWLGTRIRAESPAELALEAVLNGAGLGPQQTIIAQQTTGTGETPTWGNVRERLLRFGGDVDLFGVVCEPTETAGPTNALPTIVLLNSGAANHVGPGRLYVQMARAFAAQGFRSIRIDALGLGDSVSKNFGDENNPYPATVFRDVELTLAELRARFGAERFVLMGLCSGAYAAFQSAVQLRDPQLLESVLINPLTFYWQDGMPFDASAAEKAMDEHRRMAGATNPKKLWKFLLGKTEIGYLEAVRLLGRRIAHRFRKPERGTARSAACAPGIPLAHPTKNDLPADLARVAENGRKLALFLAENDPGYAVMAYQAPRETKQWLKTGDLRLTTIDGGDHTFSRRVPREKLIRAVTAYLQKQYPKQD